MAGNLEFIHKETISTTTSSVNVDNIFSADYDVYKITMYGITTLGTTPTTLALRFIDSGGSVISGAEYDFASLRMDSNVAFTEDRATATTSIQFIATLDQDAETMGAVTYIFNPYDSSSYSFLLNQSSGALSGNMRGSKTIGVHKVAETVRGINIIEQNGSRPLEEGYIVIYGVKG